MVRLFLGIGDDEEFDSKPIANMLGIPDDVEVDSEQIAKLLE